MATWLRNIANVIQQVLENFEKEVIGYTFRQFNGQVEYNSSGRIVQNSEIGLRLNNHGIKNMYDQDNGKYVQHRFGIRKHVLSESEPLN